MAEGASKPPLADDQIQLFAKRPKIYPRDSSLKGTFRRLKWAVMAALLAIYYFTPWLRWDRGPNLPDQAVLIDMEHGRGYFFMFEIWPQEVYILTGLLVLAALTLFFITSLFGRVWCGYACPQTVWTDLFVKVEHWLQGDRNARMKLDASPWNLEKISKKTATHMVWLLIGLATGGAWVFYFNDAPTLMRDLLQGQPPMPAVGWMIGLTLSTYFMAGYARENICTYACPYARFQSAMFDKDTLIIGYDAARGEPRGKHKQGESWEGRGHCVDCKQCVVVCPMGIDIRDGLQLQCIACGLCVDACDEVMHKLDLPPGLVRYDTTHNQQARADAQACGQPHIENLRLLRPRTLYYTILLALVGGLLLFALLARAPFTFHVLHDRNPLYVQMSDGTIRNNYTLKLLNKTGDDKTFALGLVGLDGAELRVLGATGISAQSLWVAADSVSELRVAVDLPPTSITEHRHTLNFTLTDTSTKRATQQATMFVTKE